MSPNAQCRFWLKLMTNLMSGLMKTVSNGDNPGPEMHIILIQILKFLLSPSWWMGGRGRNLAKRHGETALAKLRQQHWLNH